MKSKSPQANRGHESAFPKSTARLSSLEYIDYDVVSDGHRRSQM
jgi:hypothetical protein